RSPAEWCARAPRVCEAGCVIRQRIFSGSFALRAPAGQGAPYGVSRRCLAAAEMHCSKHRRASRIARRWPTVSVEAPGAALDVNGEFAGDPSGNAPTRAIWVMGREGLNRRVPLVEAQ